MHALAVKHDMLIAERAERIEGEVVVDDLGFLEAQDVGRGFLQKLLDDGDPEADRVDVPGDDFHACDVAPRGGGDKDRAAACRSTKRPPLRGRGARADSAFVTQADNGDTIRATGGKIPNAPHPRLSP